MSGNHLVVVNVGNERKREARVVIVSLPLLWRCPEVALPDTRSRIFRLFTQEVWGSACLECVYGMCQGRWIGWWCGISEFVYHGLPLQILLSVLLVCCDRANSLYRLSLSNIVPVLMSPDSLKMPLKCICTSIFIITINLYWPSM